MIDLPDFSKAIEYENDFYLSCDVGRMSKIMAHYELFKKTLDLPGAIVECGVFKGTSLIRLAMFRDLFANPSGKKLIAFDVFGKFPMPSLEEDKTFRKEFVAEAGEQSIGQDQLMKVLKHKQIDKNVELVKGDICKTLPEYVKKHSELKISFLNLDTDIYDPAVVILEHLWPRVVKGGVLLLDDYGIFPGENKAVDDFFKDEDIIIKKFPYCKSASYIIKE